MNMDNNLKKIRTDRGITQKELAEKINVSPSLISKWENGTVVPADEYITSMSEVFDIDAHIIEDIFINGRLTKAEDRIKRMEDSIEYDLEDLKLTLYDDIKALNSKQNSSLDEQRAIISRLNDMIKDQNDLCMRKIRHINLIMIIGFTIVVMAILYYIIILASNKPGKPEYKVPVSVHTNWEYKWEND